MSERNNAEALKIMKTTNLIAGIALITALNSISAASLDRMSSNCFRSVTVGHGTWVAVDGQGHLMASANRLDWSVRDTGNPYSLYAVAFGNGRFVAVGNEGALLTSTDGAAWTAQNSETDERLRAVAFGNGRFVAVGHGGTILTSKDGLSWTKRFSGTSERLQSVAFGHGRFVAVGWGGEILTSSKGLAWAQRNSGVANCKLSNVTFESAAFVATDHFQSQITSLDGANWTRLSIDTAGR